MFIVTFEIWMPYVSVNMYSAGAGMRWKFVSKCKDI